MKQDSVVPYGSPGKKTADVIRVEACRVYAVEIRNVSGSEVWLLLFDKGDVPPAQGDVPTTWHVVPAGAGAQSSWRVIGTDFWTEKGTLFDHGLSWGISSTPDVFNPVGVDLGGALATASFAVMIQVLT